MSGTVKALMAWGGEASRQYHWSLQWLTGTVTFSSIHWLGQCAAWLSFRRPGVLFPVIQWVDHTFTDTHTFLSCFHFSHPLSTKLILSTCRLPGLTATPTHLSHRCNPLLTDEQREDGMRA